MWRHGTHSRFNCAVNEFPGPAAVMMGPCVHIRLTLIEAESIKVPTKTSQGISSQQNTQASSQTIREQP